MNIVYYMNILLFYTIYMSIIYIYILLCFHFYFSFLFFSIILKVHSGMIRQGSLEKFSYVVMSKTSKKDVSSNQKVEITKKSDFPIVRKFAPVISPFSKKPINDENSPHLKSKMTEKYIDPWFINKTTNSYNDENPTPLNVLKQFILIQQKNALPSDQKSSSNNNNKTKTDPSNYEFTTDEIQEMDKILSTSSTTTSTTTATTTSTTTATTESDNKDNNNNNNNSHKTEGEEEDNLDTLSNIKESEINNLFKPTSTTTGTVQNEEDDDDDDEDDDDEEPDIDEYEDDDDEEDDEEDEEEELDMSRYEKYTDEYGDEYIKPIRRVDPAIQNFIDTLMDKVR